MQQDTHKTKVSFAWEPCPTCETGKSLIAIFPEIVEKTNFVSIYSPVGEHSYAHVDYLKQCEPAKPEEYQWLKDFLEKNRGYRF